jgi:hypothetical protein
MRNTSSYLPERLTLASLTKNNERRLEGSLGLKSKTMLFIIKELSEEENKYIVQIN